MARAVAYVAKHPGCRAHRCAKAIGPHGSTRYGYRAIYRAISAGLIHATRATRYHITLGLDL